MIEAAAKTSRKQKKGRKNRMKKVRGIKKAKVGTAGKVWKKQLFLMLIFFEKFKTIFVRFWFKWKLCFWDLPSFKYGVTWKLIFFLYWNYWIETVLENQESSLDKQNWEIIFCSFYRKHGIKQTFISMPRKILLCPTNWGTHGNWKKSKFRGLFT